MRPRSSLLTSIALFALLVGAVGSHPAGAVAQDGGSNTPASIALGTTFTYQGQLKSGGSPFSGSCSMAFRLYDDLTAGAQVSGAITTTVAVAGGVFTVPLDFGAGAFNGQARWLAIQVKCGADPGYSPLIPRQPLTPAPNALALPGLYTQQNATSPNLIGGYSGNVISGTLAGAVIAGGGRLGNVNTAAGDFAALGGGYGNLAGVEAFLGGGKHNTADGIEAVVGGGYLNHASDTLTTIGGGAYNVASSSESTVGGGDTNTASGNTSAVTGGYHNTASGPYSAIGGGYHNDATGSYASVPGGWLNVAHGDYSLAAGAAAHAMFDGDFVWADSQQNNFTSTGPDQFLVQANGGVGINTNTPAATLDISGSVRIGHLGTVMYLVQSGTADAGASLTYTLVFTYSFPTAFTFIPTVIATAYNDPAYDSGNLPDTFVVSVRRVTTTYVVFNIVRVDSPGLWSQNLKLNWFAWD